ncbi:hypothetical protein vseg_011179 [Gypsophila vaccaria]
MYRINHILWRFHVPLCELEARTMMCPNRHHNNLLYKEWSVSQYGWFEEDPLAQQQADFDAETTGKDREEFDVWLL